MVGVDSASNELIDKIINDPNNNITEELQDIAKIEAAEDNTNPTNVLPNKVTDTLDLPDNNLLVEEPQVVEQPPELPTVRELVELPTVQPLATNNQSTGV